MSLNLEFMSNFLLKIHALPFKSLGSVRFLKKKLILLFKDTFNWSKVTVTTFIRLQKISISINAVLLNFLLNQGILQFFLQISQKLKAAQLFSTLIIKNVSWAPNWHIRLFSEGSCDTEDWSNASELSGINYIFKYMKIENCYFKL